MQSSYTVTPNEISIHEVIQTSAEGTQVVLSEESLARVKRCREFLEKQLEDGHASYYGVNTGFGSMYNVKIARGDMQMLQHNLVRSHAAGAGAPIPEHIARTILLLKIITICKGYSGVREALLRQLVTLFNNGLTPVMYEYGSLGASGDLAPLAHLALAVIGEGAFYGKGEAQASSERLQELGFDIFPLDSKEGLALINGTQFSAGYATWVVHEAQKLLYLANLCAALSLDAFNCNAGLLDDHIHSARGQVGQSITARVIRDHLTGSTLTNGGEKELQDPYAFRCIPQVHGASYDTLIHCTDIVTREINAVTDNPLIFPDSGKILSGGNFHGQPLALVLDFLSIALAELGSIAERRTYQLLSGKRDLPDYLIERSGVQSGLMIGQYTAASLVNRNTMLCTPSSTGNAITSKTQEDHVSMSATAAIKAYELCRNCRTILAIEFLTAMQALEFRRPAQTSPFLETVRRHYRDVVPFITEDTVVRELILRTVAFLDDLSEKEFPQRSE